MKLRIKLLFTAIVLISVAFQSCTPKEKKQDASPKAKNIVLMIGDGMSFAQIQAAQYALGHPLHFREFPVTGFATTYSADNKITDSGAAGTAIATGNKSNNGMIGMTADSVKVESMLEHFSKKGKKTGLVVSCAITHATPASFVSKNISRNNYEAIAEDFSKSDFLDLFIGGGRDHFTKRKDERDLTKEMSAKGWQFFESIGQVEAAEKIALFTADVHPKPAHEGRENLLPESTELALKMLDKSENGFFLMIEGSQIDWAGHNNDSAYLVAEMADFNHTIGVVMAFAKNNPETLVVVTADHETGGLTIVSDEKGDYNNIRFHFATGGHSAVTVPVFAFGPGSQNFSGLFDNTDIIQRIYQASAE